MLLKQALEKDIEGLDESLDLLIHYIRETLVWRHRANELAKAILAGEPDGELARRAASIHKQLEAKQ
jgi:hypothetical protein